MKPIFAIYVIWLVWFLTWFVGAVLAPTSGRKSNLALEFLYRMLVLGAYALLFGLYNRFDNEYRLWMTLTGGPGWTMAGLTLSAFCLSWWARAQHGVHWKSGAARDRLRMVETGPYRLIRHPFYTGIVLASAATAAAFGTPSAMAAVVVLAAAFTLKALMEEAALRQELGANAYAAYAERVPGLMPLPHTHSTAPKRAEVPAVSPPAPDLRTAVLEAPAEIAPDLFAGQLQSEPVAAKPAKPEPVEKKKEETADTLDLFADTFGEGTSEAKSGEAPEAQPPLSEAISITKR